MTTDHITIPNAKLKGSYHFGSIAGYARFVGCHFEKIEPDKDDLLDKAIINSINYDPDSTYSITDG